MGAQERRVRELCRAKLREGGSATRIGVGACGPAAVCVGGTDHVIGCNVAPGGAHGHQNGPQRMRMPQLGGMIYQIIWLVA